MMMQFYKVHSVTNSVENEPSSLQRHTYQATTLVSSASLSGEDDEQKARTDRRGRGEMYTENTTTNIIYLCNPGYSCR